MIYIILYTTIYILNVLCFGSVVNLLIAIPEFVIVIYFSLKGRIDKALFYHLIFLATSVTNVAIGDFAGALPQYNYFSYKIVGSITLSYLINIYILVLSIVKYKKIGFNKESLFYKLTRVVILLFIVGNILGIIGLTFFEYSFKFYITYNVYIVNLLIVMLSLLLNGTPFLKKQGSKHLYYLIVSAIFSSLFLFLIGCRLMYGGVNVAVSPDMYSFSFLLIAGLKQMGKSIRNIIIIIVYLLLMFLGGASGKSFIFVLAAFGFLLFQYMGKDFIRGAFIACLGIGVVALIFTELNDGANQLFNSKLSQFLSLSQIFSGNIEGIERSPYIRVASAINIYKENIENPIYFLLGRGFGGYFTDSLNLFSGIDLYMGAFSPEQIEKGHFYSAHSSFVVVPLLNGFGGFLLLIKIVWKYISRVKLNYYALASFIWLFFMFYYNVLIAFIGVFFLFCSENPNEYGNDKK